MTMPQEELRAKPVVRQLRQICKKIARTESNVELFSEMVRQGVPSDDARCFMLQQRNKQRVNKQLNKGLIKKIMRQKYDDACVEASRLRQKRHRLRVQVWNGRGLYGRLKQV